MIVTIVIADDEDPDNAAAIVAHVAEQMREGFDCGYLDEETYWELEMDDDRHYRPSMVTINVRDGLL